MKNALLSDEAFELAKQRARRDSLALEAGTHVALDGPNANVCRLIAHADAQAAIIGNLLARIHRDGGHYQNDHGTLKAAEDADLIVATLYANGADTKHAPAGESK